MNNEKAEAVKKALDGQQNVQVVILEGKAPEQHNPKPVVIDGTITAPRMFVEKRSSTKLYDPNKSHCLISKTDGTIKLIINEQSVCNRFEVNGKIELGKYFKRLGINDLEKSYLPKELAKKLKLLRSLFQSGSEHIKIIKTLNNLEATIQRKIDDLNDGRGNTNQNFKQTVTSNMPESFEMNLPLIEGHDPFIIDVSIYLETKGNDIHCYLESMQAQEIIDQLKDDLISKEVKKLEPQTTIIYV